MSENSPEQKVLEVYRMIFPVINKILNQRKDVLVHCSQGQCRSPTLIYM